MQLINVQITLKSIDLGILQGSTSEIFHCVCTYLFSFASIVHTRRFFDNNFSFIIRYEK